ncbi:hypothetical protein [Thioalkalivibrio sp. ALE19]|uniref:hypothetical protein n=1 Tax=Thioalkalivibrio sp. ALE19 TaxID=1266909 RepID=UPI000410174E|nr:hypothetical protein [Thioalkalivibrio sp. ALE19]
MDKTIKIERPIVAVKRAEAEKPEKPADINPLQKRIESRPEGGLEAVSEKINYWTQEGKQTLYLLVSFMPVEGIVDGEKVVVERPIEFFLPTGQQTASYQWISATMRSLSLAARGGYAAQALQDLRQVTWDKGPVRCGYNEHQKPMFHNSEAAAIAFSIQMILVRRGFLDVNGNPLGVREILEAQQAKASMPEPPPEVDVEPAVPVEDSIPQPGDCPDCGGHTRMIEGCRTCPDCGWSKCA